MATFVTSLDHSVNGASKTQLNPEALLQARYTELLEKRIAQLELVIESTEQEVTKLKAAKKSEAEVTNNDPKPSVTADAKVTAAGDTVEKKTASAFLPCPSKCKSADWTLKENGDAVKETVTSAPKSRYRHIVRTFDQKTGVRNDEETDGLPEKKKQDGEVAFTYRSIVLPNEPLEKIAWSEIDIEAEGLRILLKQCIGSKYPGLNLDGDTVKILNPFDALVHNWDKLEKAVPEFPEDSEKRKQDRVDLAKLLECIKASPDLENYFKTREYNLEAHITTYDDMWTLFAPGTKIVAKLFLNQEQVLEVSRAPVPRRYHRQVAIDPKILAWCWDWNGKEMVKAYYWLAIDRFWGTQPVNELFCYPLEYYENPKTSLDEFRRLQQERGKKYWDIVHSQAGAQQMWEYDGIAVSERRSVIKTKDKLKVNERLSNNASEPEKAARKSVTVQGAFLVDPEAFLQFGADTHLLGDNEPHITGELDKDKVTRGEETPEDQELEDEYLLYPPRVLGYSTKEKIWGQFSVKDTAKVKEPDREMFDDRLQLDKKYKRMIDALVKDHGKRRDKNSQMKEVEDIVDNKGKGLVLLFHGPPGVGKTLTAETIAKATGKPLFVVSVAEIGLDASKAERNLEQMFYLAGKWEAVLLIDEADVFLESRTSDSQADRNALVSVLLRVLEYYEGIMILTTNRITSLDIAVQSRIHLAIRYDDLDRDQKFNIFRSFLKPLEYECDDFEGLMEYIKEYGSEADLNGRQIRNIVRSALSLARINKNKLLTEKHLKEVLNVTKDFQKQLDSITIEARGANEAGRSRR